MLTAMAAVPVLLTALLLVLLNPQEGYRDRSAIWRERLMEKADFTLKISPSFTFTPQVSMEADLAALKGGEKQRLPILTFTAPQDGTVYLRDQDFDTYTGKTWTSDPERSENFDGWGEEEGEITLRTFAVQNVVYLPYYPGTGTILTGGVLENAGGVTTYTFPVYSRGSAMTAEALQAYLRLPDSTRDWAREYLNGVTDPQTIGDMVRESGLYDLSTPQMPEGEQDFARWFLEESDRGFCVHFATASTVLLRAAGDPGEICHRLLQGGPGRQIRHGHHPGCPRLGGVLRRGRGLLENLGIHSLPDRCPRGRSAPGAGDGNGNRGPQCWGNHPRRARSGPVCPETGEPLAAGFSWAGAAPAAPPVCAAAASPGSHPPGGYQKAGPALLAPGRRVYPRPWAGRSPAAFWNWPSGPNSAPTALQPWTWCPFRTISGAAARS